MRNHFLPWDAVLFPSSTIPRRMVLVSRTKGCCSLIRHLFLTPLLERTYLPPQFASVVPITTTGICKQFWRSLAWSGIPFFCICRPNHSRPCFFLTTYPVDCDPAKFWTVFPQHLFHILSARVSHRRTFLICFGDFSSDVVFELFELVFSHGSPSFRSLFVQVNQVIWQVFGPPPRKRVPFPLDLLGLGKLFGLHFLFFFFSFCSVVGRFFSSLRFSSPPSHQLLLFFPFRLMSSFA